MKSMLLVLYGNNGMHEVAIFICNEGIDVRKAHAHPHTHTHTFKKEKIREESGNFCGWKTYFLLIQNIQI